MTSTQICMFSVLLLFLIIVVAQQRSQMIYLLKSWSKTLYDFSVSGSAIGKQNIFGLKRSLSLHKSYKEILHKIPYSQNSSQSDIN